MYTIQNIANYAEKLTKLFNEMNLDTVQGVLMLDDETVNYSGVVTAVRKLGKLAFWKVLSTHGTIQVVIRANEFNESFKDLLNDCTLGTHVSVSGTGIITQTKEVSILATSCNILQKSISPFPDKWNGISNDMKRKLRYQDCLVDKSVHERFVKRSKFIRAIRNFFEDNNFIEVETPILHKVACGAQARPFVTHCNAHGADRDDFFLRIAPETYLKRMTAGGFHRVFEIGKQFRNEGVDSSHMPEFTSLEYYQAYTNAEMQMMMVANLFSHLQEYGFSLGTDDIQVYQFEDCYNKFVPGLLLEETPVDQIDANFKKYVRCQPIFDKPCFIVGYPAHVAPLAKRDSKNPKNVEMWQFLWKGQEVIKCYSELVDPIEQRKLLEEQMLANQNGDSEAMMLDEGFLQTMEFGMPQQAGVGIGIDRLFALFMGIDDIRDVVFFPLGN